MAKRSHVCPAMVSFHRGIIFFGLVAIVAAGVQLMVFAFVHYTDIRWTVVEDTVNERPIEVISGGSRTLTENVKPTQEATPPPVPALGALEDTPENPAKAKQWASGREAMLKNAKDAAAAPNVNRVLSDWDMILARLTDVSACLGAVSLLALGGLASLNVIVSATGATRMGAEPIRLVAACAVWSIGLGFLGLPLSQAIPSMPLPGVFHWYDAMIASIPAPGPQMTPELAAAGPVQTPTIYIPLATHVVVPIAAMSAVVLVMLRTTTATSAGWIIEAVSELDEAVEREVAEINARNVSMSMPRVVGALNQAVGSTSEASKPQPKPPGKPGGSALKLSDNDNSRRPI